LLLWCLLFFKVCKLFFGNFTGILQRSFQYTTSVSTGQIQF
jgi:hypothetical protein